MKNLWKSLIVGAATYFAAPPVAEGQTCRQIKVEDEKNKTVQMYKSIAAVEESGIADKKVLRDEKNWGVTGIKFGENGEYEIIREVINKPGEFYPLTESKTYVTSGFDSNGNGKIDKHDAVTQRTIHSPKEIITITPTGTSILTGKKVDICYKNISGEFIENSDFCTELPAAAVRNVLKYEGK